MKVSIITVVYNNVSHIESCLRSVFSQTYQNIEYIVVDKKSNDGTEKIIQKYRNNINTIISEEDKGYTEAMNKGLKVSEGEVIGFLHSDDFYPANDIISSVVEAFQSNPADSLYGDLVYIKGKKEKVWRYWRSGDFVYGNIARGWMPPHPTFFVKRKVYEKYGALDAENFRISMDYEFILRLLYKHKITTNYIPKVLVVMRAGGISNKGIKNLIVKSREDYRVLKSHNLGLKTLLMKNLAKAPQFFKKEKINREKGEKIKRVFDISLSVFGLLFFSFFWLLILFLLFFNNKGKVFYIQKRIGKGGFEFKIIKLRTLENEKPVSFFSRFLRATALDEFPQLVNILKGDMSFVGPRALVKEELPEGSLLGQRSKVRPGLAGPAQIAISKKAKVDEKLKVDLWYIRNRSFILDIQIILFSIAATFTASWEDNFSRLKILEKIRKDVFTEYEKRN